MERHARARGQVIFIPAKKKKKKKTTAAVVILARILSNPMEQKDRREMLFLCGTALTRVERS